MILGLNSAWVWNLVCDIKGGTEAVGKNAVFWNMMLCGCGKNRRFGGTYRLHHEGEKN
jgi:pentatricopeptide repeat protein